MGVIYILKSVPHLNFQIETPPFDTVFELLQSRQLETGVVYSIFLISSFGTKRTMFHDANVKLSCQTLIYISLKIHPIIIIVIFCEIQGIDSNISQAFFLSKTHF